MASFEQHCRDCERILGDRHEQVHRWLDRHFGAKGADHRRILHHTRGVDEVEEMWGRKAAEAAVVHIVRDCGKVPRERDYYRPSQGIEIAPAYIAPKLGYEQWFGEFQEQAEREIKRILGG